MIGGAVTVGGQGAASSALVERPEEEQLPLDLEFYVADFGDGSRPEWRDAAATGPRGQEQQQHGSAQSQSQTQGTPRSGDPRPGEFGPRSGVEGVGGAESDEVVQAIDEENEAHAVRQEPELPAGAEPEDFWQNVVQLHQQFSQDPQRHPRALDSAILWAAMAASTTALPPSVTARPGAPGVAAAERGQSQARPSLADRAVDALVVAWQQRDSALAAVGRGRG